MAWPQVAKQWQRLQKQLKAKWRDFKEAVAGQPQPVLRVLEIEPGPSRLAFPPILVPCPAPAGAPAKRR
jgi:hypothetical protein